jgi:hypothetical protein
MVGDAGDLDVACRRGVDMSATEGRKDIAELADLLRETSEHHGVFEAVAPKHDWWDWYAAYMTAREHGSDPDGAAQAAGVYMEQARGIRVVPPVSGAST